MLPLNSSQSPLNKLKLFPKDRQRVDKAIEKARKTISDSRRYEELRMQIEQDVRKLYPSPNPPMNTFIAMNPISDQRARELDSIFAGNARTQINKHEEFIKNKIKTQLYDACRREGISVPST